MLKNSYIPQCKKSFNNQNKFVEVLTGCVLVNHPAASHCILLFFLRSLTPFVNAFAAAVLHNNNNKMNYKIKLPFAGAN